MDQGDNLMAINRRTFSADLVAGAAASLTSIRGMAAPAASTKARNVVLVHGLFADGSSWSEVIARLQAAGLNATAVQNPLTTLPEAVAAAARLGHHVDERRRREAAFLCAFAGDLPEAKEKVLYAVQEPFHKALLTGKTTHAAWRAKPCYYTVSVEDRETN